MKHAADEATSRSKCRFISEILRGDLDVFRAGGGGAVPEEVLIKDLRTRGYPTTAQLRAMQGILLGSAGSTNEVGSSSDDSEDADQESQSGIEPVQGESQAQSPSDRSSYAYLLDLPIRSLTDVRSAMLMKEAEQTQRNLAALQAKSESDLWLADLDALTTTYEKHCM